MSLGRSFRILWSAGAASNLADGLAFVAVPLLAASLTDDPRLIAGLATVYALVRLVVALPVGAWVDRVDRRSLLAAANLIRGLAVVALAVSVQSGIAGLLALYLAFALLGALESAADNTSLALVPNVVAQRDLDRANGRVSTAQLIADEFAGPPLGGLLFAVAAALPIYVMGGLWGLAGLLALALPPRSRHRETDAQPAHRPGIWREAADGARWLTRHRTVGALALIGALASVGYMLPFSILVLFTQNRLNVDSAGYGLILAFSAVGGLVGSATTGWIRLRLGYRTTIIASLVVGAVSLLALAVTSDALLAALILGVYIFHAVTWGICATSLRQQLVPDGLRGRVTAASKVLGLLGLALGSALGGLLAVIDLTLPVFVGGIVFAACAGLAAFTLPRADPAQHSTDERLAT